MRERLVLLLSLTLALALPNPLFAAEDRGTSASAEENSSETEEARIHFHRGVELFKERSFRAALVEFQRAHQISPNWRVLYNIGQAQVEIGDYAGALRSFRQYLAEGATEIAEERTAAVRRELETLSTRVGELKIVVDEPGATLFVDEEPVGTAPLSTPVLVSVGRRKVEARLAGSVSTQYVDVAGGDVAELKLTLALKRRPKSAPEPNAVRHRPVRPGSEEPASNTPLWVGLGLTGALAGGAATMGVLALRSKRDYDRALEEYPGSAGEVDSARDDTRTFALISDVLGGAAVVAGVTTLVVALSSGSESEERVAARPAIDVAVVPGSVTVRGHF